MLELARNLIRLSGFVPEKEIPITFVGLRPGEKLEDELVGESEKTEQSSVPKILRIRPTRLPNLTLLSQKIREFEGSKALSESGLVI